MLRENETLVSMNFESEQARNVFESGLNAVKAEARAPKMTRGSVAAVTVPGKPDSAGSQFFIMTTGSESWGEQLDGQYSLFGHVLEGQDVVDRISQLPRDARDRPLENVTIESVAIVSR